MTQRQRLDDGVMMREMREWPLKFVLCLLFDLDPDCILCGQSAAAVITVT